MSRESVIYLRLFPREELFLHLKNCSVRREITPSQIKTSDSIKNDIAVQVVSREKCWKSEASYGLRYTDINIMKRSKWRSIERRTRHYFHTLLSIELLCSKSSRKCLNLYLEMRINVAFHDVEKKHKFFFGMPFSHISYFSLSFSFSFCVLRVCFSFHI